MAALTKGDFEETVIQRRRIETERGDKSDRIDSNGRAHLYKVLEEHVSIQCFAVVEDVLRRKFLTLQRTEEGKIFLEKIHHRKLSNLRTSDELIAVDGNAINYLNINQLQRELFVFKLSESGRLAKQLTIWRKTSDDGIEELVVEVTIMTKVLSVSETSSSRFSPSSRGRGSRRPQIRNVLLCRERDIPEESVVIKTGNNRFLTMRDGCIVGDTFSEDRIDDFTFTLVPVNAVYQRNVRPLRRSVICCKIKWKNLWISTSGDILNGTSMELVQDGYDSGGKCNVNHVFKRRVKSGGSYGTGFECLLYKNVYLVFNPASNKVEIRPYNPRIDVGKTLKNLPPSTLFDIAPASSFHRPISASPALLNKPRDLSESSNDESSDQDSDESEAELTHGCLSCFRCCRTKKKKHPKNKAVPLPSVQKGPTFELALDSTNNTLTTTDQPST